MTPTLANRGGAGPALRRWGLDVAIALFLVGVSVSIVLSLDRGGRPPPAWVLPLLVVHAGVLTWRRVAPLPVWGVNLATGVAVAALGLPLVTLGVAVLVALYTVASLCPRVRSLTVLAVTTAAMAAGIAASDSQGDATTALGNAVAFGVVWFLGDSQRQRRAYVAQLEERTAELERARDELARTAAAEERLRIARELHDVVAHSMGMIAVQAGVGAHVIDARPDEAKRSLQTIEKASKSALGEIRRMLGLLRPGDEAADTGPSPGIRDLTRLAAEVTAAGVTVEVHADEPPPGLSEGAELTIYRIVQEALTNVIRHAHATRVRVALRFTEDAARIEIVDDGTQRSAGHSGGHGIEGMRERAALHGGTLDAAPLPEGGFRVAAEIPTEERAR